MKRSWAKGNTWLLTLTAVCVTAWILICWSKIAPGQKALCFFLIALTLHEWEEGYFPGGFYELM